MGTNCINGIPTASYMPHTQVIRQSGRGLCWGATRRGIAGATHCDANGPVCVNTSTHSLPLLPLCILLSSIAVDCPCLENPIARHTQSCRRTDPQQSNHRKTRAQHHQKPRSRSPSARRHVGPSLLREKPQEPDLFKSPVDLNLDIAPNSIVGLIFSNTVPERASWKLSIAKPAIALGEG